jgi:hypothetical protein
MRMTQPRVEGETLDSHLSRVQHGDPDRPHHHHTAVGEHSGTSGHLDSLTADRRTIA